MRGYLSEGRAWVDATLDRHGEEQSMYKVGVLLAAGHIAHWQADLDVARRHLEEGLDLARSIGETEQVVRALNGLGAIESFSGDMARAVAYFEECLLLARQIGSSHYLSSASCNLGIVAAQQGNLDRGTRLLEEALAYSRVAGDTYGQIVSLMNLGQVTLGRKDWAQAMKLLRDGMTQAVELDSGDGQIADGLASFGIAAGLTGQPMAAARLLGAACAMLESIGSYLDLVLPAQHDEVAAAVREVLGDADYMAARAAGRNLSKEAAIAEALALRVDDMVPTGRDAE